VTGKRGKLGGVLSLNVGGNIRGEERQLPPRRTKQKDAAEHSKFIVGRDFEEEGSRVRVWGVAGEAKVDWGWPGLHQWEIPPKEVLLSGTFQ